MRNPWNKIKADWAELTPAGKAWAVTLTVGVTAINPLYPLVYGATYAAYTAAQEDDSEQGSK